MQPTANGGTGDNLLVTLRYGTSEEKLAARLGPTGLSHIHEVSIGGEHFRVLQTLESTQVPSPRPLWLENDPAVLGVPYGGNPGVRAWPRALGLPDLQRVRLPVRRCPAYRRSVWDAAMDALAAVHKLDAGLFGYLDRPDRGPNGLRQHVAYLREAFTDSPIWNRTGRSSALWTGWPPRRQPPSYRICLGGCLYGEYYL